MNDFDVSSIPMEFNPLSTLDNLHQQNQYVGDDKLFIQFKTEPVMNPAASTKEGRPIYDDVDMIIIRTPGSQLTSIVAPVKEYMSRFGDKYRAWKAKQAEVVKGTPLENFPLLFSKPSLVAELRALNIQTVEQLAELPDGYKQKIMGAHELCRRAALWIEKSKNDAEDGEKEALKARLAEMEAKLAALSEAPVKRRSRGEVESVPVISPEPLPA